MKIFFSVILILISVCVLNAQDTTRYEMTTKSGAPISRAFFEYGMDNNSYTALNQILIANSLCGNFNSISYSRWGYGFISGNHKNKDVEVNFGFSGQEFTESNRNYRCSFLGLKLLGHYNYFNQHRFIASITSGLNLQLMNFRIDTVYNSTRFVNYYSSKLSNYFLYIPLGLDFKYRIGEKFRIKEKSPVGFVVGLRASYNFYVIQSGWFQNEQNFSYPDMNTPGYFEVTVILGMY